VGVRSQEAAALSADRKVIDKNDEDRAAARLRGEECKCKAVLCVGHRLFCRL